MPSREPVVSAARRDVLERLRRAGEPLDASTVAGLLGTHVTTARFHLEQLAADGLVARRPAVEKRRGRPRHLYELAPTTGDDPREQLIRVLAAALDEREDGSLRAVEAGRRWAAELGPLDEDDPVGSLVERLDGFGFGPEAGDAEIRLRDCPFRDAARIHPGVVCAAHAGLVEALLDRSRLRGRLLPFVEPELCLVITQGDAESAPT